MNTLFDITGDDIALLNDAELRSLIGLLCEADYRLAGLSTRGITWGGSQDAADGGLDVVVRQKDVTPANSFIPNKMTGFQVKKPDMPRAGIIKEMRPEGILRQTIKDLIQEKGAYVIVSSTGSVTDSALKRRLDAMREAVQGEDGFENLELEFMDRGRVATWVRFHPSLVLWIRRKIGKPLTGWSPYGNWAKAPGGEEEEYLLDENLRLFDTATADETSLTVTEGIEKLRKKLATPKECVRLVGLSGVGKTRLVQALFDERIGEHTLNRSLAFYADITDTPSPDPQDLARYLIADQSKAILIVDNCPPEIHRQLTGICTQADSQISLLTVEYDVRDDLPEETAVFRLEPAGQELIEKLLANRCSHLSQVVSARIAEFSEGNARVALALASTVKRGETVSDLRDESLFERLFWQRNPQDKDLLLTAEIASLVYSFDGENTSSEASELHFLAALAHQPDHVFYRNVQELRQRNLVQSRNIWRAVLPHAIANRLAKRALESMPRATIVDAFLECDLERLLQSFSRRLGYLHDCPAAVDIVDEWLSSQGLLGQSLDNLNSLGITLLKNIAPVSPAKLLDLIERVANSDDKGPLFTAKKNPNHAKFVQLLRLLAYEPQTFKRCTKLLIRFALSESPDEKNNPTRDVLQSLFYLYLSGTHAPAEARAEVIESLVYADEDDKQQLGLLLLDAALKSNNFSSLHEFSFGARPRDYGYVPKTGQDVLNWYKTFLDIGVVLTNADTGIVRKTRTLLADHLRGLWSVGLHDILKHTVKQIHETTPWHEGWLGILSVLQYDKKRMSEDMLSDIKELELMLRPKTLLQQARAYALSDQYRIYDFESDDDDNESISASVERAEETTRHIGAAVAQDEAVLQELLPEIFCTSNTRLFSLGRGLAEGCSDLASFWQKLYSQFRETAPKKRQTNVLRGFLFGCKEKDSDFLNARLDAIVEDPILGPYFMDFQRMFPDGQGTMNRLHHSLQAGQAPIHSYIYIGCGKFHESISDRDLITLLEHILSKDNGINIVVDILQMRFLSDSKNTKIYSKELRHFACKTLEMYPYATHNSSGNDGSDHDLSRIADKVLHDEDGYFTAAKLCHRLLSAIDSHEISPYDYHELLASLAKQQPNCFLDAFLDNPDIVDKDCEILFSKGSDFGKNPLTSIPDNVLLSWSRQKPEKRYPLLASAIDPIQRASNNGSIAWNPLVYSLLDESADPAVVFSSVQASMIPTTWCGGSLRTTLEDWLRLFEQFFNHKNDRIAAAARRQYRLFKEEIEWRSGLDDTTSRIRLQSFE
ncbi:MAG: hypothetical protein AAF329_04680 [Cyanobacteria bacterium P01_A01_bin.17]